MKNEEILKKNESLSQFSGSVRKNILELMDLARQDAEKKIRCPEDCTKCICGKRIAELSELLKESLDWYGIGCTCHGDRRGLPPVCPPHTFKMEIEEALKDSMNHVCSYEAYNEKNCPHWKSDIIELKDKRIAELSLLLEEAYGELYCPDYGKTATHPCNCKGCDIRRGIEKALTEGKDEL